MRDYEFIRDLTDPLGVKKLNDQLQMLWNKTKNTTGKDIRFDTIEAGSLIVGNNVSMGPDAYISWGNVSSKPSLVYPSDIMDFVTSSNVYTIIGGDYVITGKIYADRIYGGSLTLGGSLNARGTLEIRDASNNTVMTLNNTGLHMEVGSINTRDQYTNDERTKVQGNSIEQYNTSGKRRTRLDTDGLYQYSAPSSSDEGLLTGSFRSSWWANSKDNVRIASHRSNADIILSPDGSGKVILSTVVDIGTAGAQLDGTGGNARLRSASGNTTVTAQADGNVVFYHSGTARHVFTAAGTKTGGSIEIEGHNYGMSPIDSPRILISDLMCNVQATEEGTLVELDSTLSKAINGYSVFVSGEAKVTDKTKESFIIKGTEIVDLYIIGTRVQQEDVYWMELPKDEEDIADED